MVSNTKDSSKKRDVLKFFREVRSELKKVIWPSRAQLINNTLTVLLACLLIGILIWIADGALTFVRDRLYNL